MEYHTLLKLEAITKQFPGVKALDSVDLDVRFGEVHAIVGENGAGKSTLIKIVSGAYTNDSGTIEFDGEKIGALTPHISLEKGISVIYQELSYLPTMSIAENIYIGRHHKKKNRTVDYKALFENSRRMQALVGLEHYPPSTEVRMLSTAEKQLIEIARAQVRDMKLLILDEPTSALNEEEIHRLFAIIHKLRAQGCGVIYITHKMDEIFKIADRVTVMRDGRRILTEDMANISRADIIKAMVGREIREFYPISPHGVGDVLLEIENLSSGILKDVSFRAHKGEILGFYGLMGCGSERAMECVFGKVPMEKGVIKVDGKRVKVRSPRDAIRHKIAYAPGERKTEGLMLIQPVRVNISCVTLSKVKKNGLLNLKLERSMASRWIKQLRIKTPSPEMPISSLSGGNQQKVVLAKWMENQPRVFLLNEPTKGVDVGAKTEIYMQMEEICRNGATVVFITSDLPELLAISDRVYVFHEGTITGEIVRKDLTQENVAKKAIGEAAHEKE